jgi:hypothetical protein
MGQSSQAKGEAMTQAEAKMRILAEWRTWIGHQRATGFNTTAEALVFFGEIQQNQPDLLPFEGPDEDVDGQDFHCPFVRSCSPNTPFMH